MIHEMKRFIIFQERDWERYVQTANRGSPKIFFGITFLGTRLKSAAKPPDGLDGLRPDPLTVRSVKAGVQGTEFF